MTIKATAFLKRLWIKTATKSTGQFITILQREIEGCRESLLDVGCGFHSPVERLQAKPNLVVGVDAFKPALEESRAKGIHHEYHELDILKIGERFSAKSFECVIALDVIEHLSEENALKLISQMERIAKKKVIIYTPNGFLPQGEEYGNPWQKHLSGWTAKQMKLFGYRVYGINGLIYLRGEMFRIRWKPALLWTLISFLSQPLTQRLPSFAFQLLCIKDVCDETK